MAKTPVIDQWLLNADGTPDPFAGTVDFGMTKADELDPDLLLDEHPVLNPEIITGPPAPSDEEPLEEPVVSVPIEPQDDGPEVIDLGDGATVTRTKERGQWKAVLDPGTGANPEVFWGKTKDELLSTVLKGKLEATRKIRELNKKAKLTAPVAPKPIQQAPQASVRQLTADEIFEIKTLQESDPAAALDALIKKRTGLTLEDLVSKAQKGDQASMSLETEAVSREFLGRNPDYYPDSDNKNFQSLIKWLAKFKLGKNATESNSQEIFSEIWSTGNYTVETLEEAFQDLTDDGLLVKPRLPKPPPPVEVPSVPPAPQPAPATSTPRIVKTETRPRAALGIRSSDITPVAPPTTPTAPTDEDFQNMSDADIAELTRAALRFKAKARRS